MPQSSGSPQTPKCVAESQEGRRQKLILAMLFSTVLALAGEVTGTAGPNADEQTDIRNGKVNGQKLTFEVLHDGRPM